MFYKDILFLLKISEPAYSEELVKLADWVENDKLERHFHVFVAKEVPTFCFKSTGSLFFHKLPLCVWWKYDLMQGTHVFFYLHNLISNTQNVTAKGPHCMKL